MPFSNYADLKAEVAAWLRRSDLAAEIPSFVALAEAQMNRRLRVRQMSVSAPATFDAEYLDLPPGFLAEREISVVVGGAAYPLAYMTAEGMDRASRGAAAGRPRFYAIYGSQLRLSPAPDASYQGEVVYLQGIRALADDDDSNWLLQAYPDAYLYGALVQSAPYLRADERLQTWGALFTTILADIEAADRTGAAARLRADSALMAHARNRGFDIQTGS